jgi:hypothetical protein
MSCDKTSESQNTVQQHRRLVACNYLTNMEIFFIIGKRTTHINSYFFIIKLMSAIVTSLLFQAIICWLLLLLYDALYGFKFKGC